MDCRTAPTSIAVKKGLAPLYINGAAGVGVGVERLWGITMTTDIFVECMTQQYIQEAI